MTTILRRSRAGFLVAALGLVSLLTGCGTVGDVPDLTEVRGELEVRVHGDAVTSEARTEYLLRSATGEWIEVVFEGADHHDAPLLLSGARVLVKGVRVAGGAISVDHELGGSIEVLEGDAGEGLGSARAALTAAGPKKTAVLLFNFADDASQPIDRETARAATFTSEKSTNAYYREISFGRSGLVGKTDPAGDVFGWYTINSPSTPCDWSVWRSEATQAAVADGVDLGGYDIIVLAYPNPSGACPGLGTLGGLPATSWVEATTSWSDPLSYSRYVLTHEIGHNFGVHHANSFTCTDANGARVSVSESCTSNEYGDPFDVMAGAFQWHMNNFHKGLLGWIDGGTTATVSGQGEFTIAPVEKSSSAPLALRIYRGKRVIDGKERPEFYYLEYRQPIGFDADDPARPVFQGVTLRLAPDYSVLAHPNVIDTTPETATYEDAPLGVGNTFSDAAKGIHITVLGVSSEGARVKISAPTDTTPPTTPAGLASPKQTQTSIELAWQPATDDVAIGGYEILRNGALVGTTTGTTRFTDEGCAPKTTYSYAVRALDIGGNRSPASAPLQATTLGLLTQQTLEAAVVADAYVDEAKPDYNFGRSPALAVDNTPLARKYAYFRVDPSQLAPGTIEKASLSIHFPEGPGSAQTLAWELVDDAWSESCPLGFSGDEAVNCGSAAISWSNQPGAVQPLGSRSIALAGGWQHLDVTPALLASGGKPFSVRVSLSPITQGNLNGSPPGPRVIAAQDGYSDRPRVTVEYRPSDRFDVLADTFTDPRTPDTSHGEATKLVAGAEDGAEGPFVWASFGPLGDVVRGGRSSGRLWAYVDQVGTSTLNGFEVLGFARSIDETALTWSTQPAPEEGTPLGASPGDTWLGISVGSLATTTSGWVRIDLEHLDVFADRPLTVRLNALNAPLLVSSKEEQVLLQSATIANGAKPVLRRMVLEVFR